MVVLVTLIYLVTVPYIYSEAKKFSPAKTTRLDLKGSELEVEYSSPPKKRKFIFYIKIPDWGVTHVDGKQNTHEGKFNYLSVEVPMKKLKDLVGVSSIDFESVATDLQAQDYLSLACDVA